MGSIGPPGPLSSGRLRCHRCVGPNIVEITSGDKGNLSIQLHLKNQWPISNKCAVSLAGLVQVLKIDYPHRRNDTSNKLLKAALLDRGPRRCFRDTRKFNIRDHRPISFLTISSYRYTDSCGSRLHRPMVQLTQRYQPTQSRTAWEWPEPRARGPVRPR